MKNIGSNAFLEKYSLLKKALFHFDKNLVEQKIQLMDELASSCDLKAKSIKSVHQLLLGLMAYPDDKKLLIKAEEAMSNLYRKIYDHGSLQNTLIASGYYSTNIECNFSYAIVRFLTQHFPGQITIHSASSSVDSQKAVLKLLLPHTEYSLIHSCEKDLKQRIKQFKGNNTLTDLEWLLQLIAQSPMIEKEKAFVYNQLGVFIQWKISSLDKSVGLLRGPNSPVYYHKEALDKKTDLHSIINKKLPAPKKLSAVEKENIITAARLSLVYLYRETEPFSNANNNDITLFELDKGISIALFGSIPEKRYSLESYIGYMVFKNNIPMSYGGGWLFGERCQFGINILEAFRGGESSLVICELLRVYHQYFGAQRFVVKPYQFGLHNNEAIKTGAFWFYYKLGFRPEDEKLKALALEEENQKLKNPNYKSTEATLRNYTKSNLALVLKPNAFPIYDAEALSQKITQHINQTFNGDREKALNTCYTRLKKNLNLTTKNWKEIDVEYAKQLSVLFDTMPNSKEWQLKNKDQIVKLVLLKSETTELPWILHLRKFKAFWDLF